MSSPVDGWTVQRESDENDEGEFDERRATSDEKGKRTPRAPSNEFGARRDRRANTTFDEFGKPTPRSISEHRDLHARVIKNGV
jgi:hypothetical protein